MTSLALIVWPVLTLLLVFRLPFAQAAMISLVGGYLLLPTEGGWNAPLLPGLNKNTIPSLTLLVLALLFYREPSRSRVGDVPGTPCALPGWIPRSPLAIIGLFMIVAGAFMTALTNGDPLVYGPNVRRGLNLYDGASMALTWMTILIPLLLGRKFFAHPDAHGLLLRGLAIAGAAYTLLALYEIRMSPRINSMVYGFFPHDWQQHIRPGGWRPIVFMNHGLQLAIFFTMATLAAFGASRIVKPALRVRYMLGGGWILGTLVLSNSFGAAVIAVLLLPVILFLGTRLQLVCAAVVAGMVLFYPMLRGADLVPTGAIVSMASNVHADRAASLQFRVNNEDLLLAHAFERPLFGWGIESRSRIFDDRGRDSVVTDGFWIVVIGQSGWVGYLAQFGLMTLPIILLAFFMRRYEISYGTAILAVVLAAALIDLIPNGFRSPISLLVAGALWGRWELGRIAVAEGQETAPEPSQRLIYNRSPQEEPRPSDADLASAGGTPPYTRYATQRQRLRKSF
jgi:hypothetical protein